MMGKTKSAPQTSDRRENRRFVQPLAVALVFLLFALLFFGMAMMDLGRLEGLLMDGLRKKALTVVEATETSFQDKYRLLLRGSDEDHNPYGSLGVEDEAFILQESLAQALIDIAREVEVQAQTSTLSPDTLRDLTVVESLQAIALLDPTGRPILQSGPLPAGVASHLRTLLEDKEDVVIHLFHGSAEDDGIGFIGIHNAGGKGAVVLTIDRQGLETWGRRVALQAAVDALQWGKGVAYLSVENAAGQPLARAGTIAREKVEECLLVASAARDPADLNGHCVKVGDMKLLELSFPFRHDGEMIATARVGLETQETDKLLTENRRHIFLWTALMVTIGLFAMALLYQTQNRHVARLQAMGERLHQAEKLSSLGKLGAGVAHEIRNPLNAISMAVQRLQREFRPTATENTRPFDRITYIVRDEIRRLNGIVEDFLSLSRSNRLDLQPQPVTFLLERVFFLVHDEAQARGVRLEKQWPQETPSIVMDARKMEQALLNIVRNAVESIPGEGLVTIVCEPLENHFLSIRIRDSGVGLAGGEEKRIFDPFYTTKEKGVGLGLAIAREIIVAHGGEIRVASREGEGTTFEVLLPHQGNGHRKAERPWSPSKAG
jgi:signal transduction histidine kinase